MLLRLLRQVAAVICQELETNYAAELAVQPGRLFFPKRVYVLDPLEPDTPDGISLDYIRIAVAKDEGLWQGVTPDTAVATLASHVSQQISCAAFLERHILQRLSGKK